VVKTIEFLLSWTTLNSEFEWFDWFMNEKVDCVSSFTNRLIVSGKLEIEECIGLTSIANRVGTAGELKGVHLDHETLVFEDWRLVFFGLDEADSYL
jgi:hypothetical protein